MLPSSALPGRSRNPLDDGRKSPTSAAMSSRRRSSEGRLLLETAGPLVPADVFPGASPPQAVDELARAVLRVGFGRRKPQHRSITGLHLHAAGKPARAENAMHPRQVVTGNVEQEM